MAIFCTDAGHGGRDSGAAWNATLEKDLNLIYTQGLNAELKRMGHTVYTTRTGDVQVPSLNTRCRLVNAHHSQNAPLFDAIISLHCNVAAFKENGTYRAKPERYGFYAIYSQESASSSSLAQILAQNCSSASIRLNHDGMLSTAQLGRTLAWIHKTRPTAVLLELGFMTNEDELAQLKSKEYQHKMIETLAQGIVEFAAE